MENLKNNFSLRETLEILLPGIYFIALLVPIISQSSFGNFPLNSVSNLALFIILSISFGILLYALDVPKRLWFFENILPTNIIEKELRKKKNKELTIKIHNAYFSFKDKEISFDLKNKIDIFTGIYHFSVNISISSIILIIFYSFHGFITKSFNNNLLIIIITLLLSMFNSYYIIYSPKKIKFMFFRQVQKFKESEEYQSLVNS